MCETPCSPIDTRSQGPVARTSRSKETALLHELGLQRSAVFPTTCHLVMPGAEGLDPGMMTCRSVIVQGFLFVRLLVLLNKNFNSDQVSGKINPPKLGEIERPHMPSKFRSIVLVKDQRGCGVVSNRGVGEPPLH